MLKGLAGLAVSVALSLSAAGPAQEPARGTPAPRAAGHAPAPAASTTAQASPLFVTGSECFACHNGLTTPAGEDISFGTHWQASIMANSARDPYWQASVRRETLDHPAAASLVEEECSVCHMPMSYTTERANGQPPRIFAHLPIGAPTAPAAALAADGVSCTVCHQIRPDRLGAPESFTGGFVIDTTTPFEERPIFGPYAVNRGRTTVMHSATGFIQTRASHLGDPALCSTCHTLYTTPLGSDGQPIGRFPEQVPFLEWQQSAYRDSKTCQGCHMPIVEQPTRFASVLGDERPGVSRHTFRGGNFFMLRMLNRYRTELGVAAPSEALEADAQGTLAQLQTRTARVHVDSAVAVAGTATIVVSVENLTGHKLPTAYPSRRAWLHVMLLDDSGRVVFESGRLEPDGSIAGNDNDADATRYEPHYEEIRGPEQVQIYEDIMEDQGGRVTTGLLQAVRYVKDNRLLPRGFDKPAASSDTAVVGGALADASFTGGSDRVRYVVSLAPNSAPVRVEVELWYQPIGFRWAHNLDRYDASEPRRFVEYFREMALGASTVLAKDADIVR